MQHQNLLGNGRVSLTASPIAPKRPRSPLSSFNYRVFVVPVVLMLVGALIWVFAVLFLAGDSTLVLVGEVILAVGVFVAILLGFWVMTLIRLPQW